MNLTVQIPDHVADALLLPPAEREAELRKELALALYARGVLGVGKAHELAVLTRWQFEELLGQRRIVRPYSLEDVADDLRYAEGRQ